MSVDIYILKCPFTEEVRYVGKTKRGLRRKYEHNSFYKTSSSHAKHYVHYWTLKLLRAGHKPIYEVIDNVPENECNFWERYYIRLFKSIGMRLCNLSAGGEMDCVSKNHNSKFLKGKKLEDYYGIEKANEIKNKLSIAARGKNNPNYGRKFDKGFCENQMIIQSRKPIFILDSNGLFLREFINSRKAAEYVGCSAGSIRIAKHRKDCIKGKYKVIDKIN